MQWHAGMFTRSESLTTWRPLPPPALCLGKAIYYAKSDIAMTEELFGKLKASEATRFLGETGFLLPVYADIPRLGTVVKAGQPVLSFFVSDENAANCRRNLEKKAIFLDNLFASE